MKRIKYEDIPVQIKCVVWVFICSILQKGISVLTTPIFTRLLSAEEYGQYNVFNSWLGIITVIVSLELYKSVFEQGLVKFADDRNVFFQSMQGLCIGLISVWFFIYLCFSDFFNTLLGVSTPQMLLMFLLITSTAIFRFWCAEQRVLYKYRLLTLITVIVSLVKPILSILLIGCMRDNVMARILGIAVAELVGYSIVLFTRAKTNGIHITTRYWKYGLALGLPLVAHYLSQTLLESADRIMISKMVGDDASGIYSLSSSLSSLLLIINSSLLYSFSPWIYQKIKEKEYKAISNIEYLLMLVVGFANILLILMAPEIIKIFAPKEYYEAIWIIPPIAISSFYIFLYELFARFEFYFEKTWNITFATVVSALLNMFLNYILIKEYGYIAAGYTTMICYAMNALWHYLVMKHILRKEVGRERVYNGKIILLLSFGFGILGLAFLPLYKLFFGYRYIIFIAILVFLFFVVKKILKRIDIKKMYKL